jgi:hypothetical protein
MSFENPSEFGETNPQPAHSLPLPVSVIFGIWSLSSFTTAYALSRLFIYWNTITETKSPDIQRLELNRKIISFLRSPIASQNNLPIPVALAQSELSNALNTLHALEEELNSRSEGAKSHTPSVPLTPTTHNDGTINHFPSQQQLPQSDELSSIQFELNRIRIKQHSTEMGLLDIDQVSNIIIRVCEHYAMFVKLLKLPALPPTPTINIYQPTETRFKQFQLPDGLLNTSDIQDLVELVLLELILGPNATTIY